MTAKTPWHLWFVGVVSLLWNSVGAFDYVMTQTKNESYMSAFTAAELDYFYNLPTQAVAGWAIWAVAGWAIWAVAGWAIWTVTSWALAIWTCVLGSVLILMKKKLSVPVLLISIVVLIATTVYNYGLSNGYEIMGGVNALVCTGLIYATTIGLYVYARSMTSKGLSN